MSITIKNILILLIIPFTINGNCQDKVGLVASDFVGKTTQNKAIKLSDYLGKVVLLDFWASWCPPCREEMPELIKFYKTNKDDKFEIIAVNIDNDTENMKTFLDKFSSKPSFPIVVDNNQKIPPLFDIETMPTTIFIDKKGIIRFRHDGFKISYINDFNVELKQLLKEK